MAGKKVTWRATSIEGMTFGWKRAGETLHIELKSNGNGWVAVGFNNRPELHGSRLFMGRVVGGEVHVEEHWTKPPNHGPIEIQNSVFAVEGREQNGTWIKFSIRKIPESHTHVTLAWSDDDDFQHHSRIRRLVEIPN